MFLAVTLPGPFATLAFAAGVLGMAATVWLAPRRWALSSLALWIGFTCLLGTGVLGVGQSAESQWAGLLATGALAALCAGGVLLILDLRARDRQARVATAETEGLRREVERMTGINVRFEDEIRELRRKARAGEEARLGSGMVMEATLARQRKALDTAASQARRHRAVFDGAVEGMALLERETLRLGDVNAALQRLTGLDAKALGERSLLDILADVPGRPGRADLQRHARERRPIAVVLGGDGKRETLCEMTVTAVGEGEDTQLLAVIRDTSDRQAIERDQEEQVRILRERIRAVETANADLEAQNRNLEQANGRLAEISDRKDHYLSSVSHELRTPLTSIRSFSEILLKHGESEPTVRQEFLEIIHKESERLTRLVNNVLDLARIEAGATKLILSEFDACIVATDAIASMQGLAAEAGVRVVAHPGDVVRTLRADRDRVQQVLMNLVGNAIKFSPEGAEVTLTVDRGDREGRVRFSVRDHGRGIPPEDMERVFDRFHRVDDEPGIAGTGLGLSICREIVTMHGGKIWVESTMGEGSIFQVEMPGVEEARQRGLGLAPASGILPPAAPLPDVLPRLGAREPQSAPSARGARDPWSTTGTLPPLGR